MARKKTWQRPHQARENAEAEIEQDAEGDERRRDLDREGKAAPDRLTARWPRRPPPQPPGGRGRSVANRQSRVMRSEEKISVMPSSASSLPIAAAGRPWPDRRHGEGQAELLSDDVAGRLQSPDHHAHGKAEHKPDSDLADQDGDDRCGVPPAGRRVRVSGNRTRVRSSAEPSAPAPGSLLADPRHQHHERADPREGEHERGRDLGNQEVDRARLYRAAMFSSSPRLRGEGLAASLRGERSEGEGEGGSGSALTGQAPSPSPCGLAASAGSPMLPSPRSDLGCSRDPLFCAQVGNTQLACGER